MPCVSFARRSRGSSSASRRYLGLVGMSIRLDPERIRCGGDSHPGRTLSSGGAGPVQAHALTKTQAMSLPAGLGPATIHPTRWGVKCCKWQNGQSARTALGATIVQVIFGLRGLHWQFHQVSAVIPKKDHAVTLKLRKHILQPQCSQQFSEFLHKYAAC